MKRFNILSIVVIVFVILGSSMALLSGETKESLEYRTLSLENVTRAFEQNDLSLVPVEEDQDKVIILDGVKPAAYQIRNTEDRVYLYIFKSHEDRYNFSFNPSSRPLREPFLPYGRNTFVTMAKNVLCMYVPQYASLMPGDLVLKRANKIKELMFSDLNKGRTLVFRGEGEFWEAQAIYRSTSQFYKDTKGVLHVDSWETENRMARYKGADISEVGPIRFKINKPHGASRGTGFTLDSNGVVRLGGGGSNGALNDIEDIYTITIEWDDQSETFDLKAYADPFVLFLN